MSTIEEIIAGRDLIPWKDLSACFKASPRGMGLTYRTIQAWMVAKPFSLPRVRDGRRLLFSWPEVWDWYKIHHHRGGIAA